MPLTCVAKLPERTCFKCQLLTFLAADRRMYFVNDTMRRVTLACRIRKKEEERMFCI